MRVVEISIRPKEFRAQLDLTNTGLLPIEIRESSIDDVAKRNDPAILFALQEKVLPLFAGTFMWALAMMERGYRVRRQEWRQKGSWICYGEPPSYGNLKLDGCPGNSELDAWFKRNGEIAGMKPTIVLKTRDGDIHFGWLPTHCGMFATDWELVPDNE